MINTIFCVVNLSKCIFFTWGLDDASAVEGKILKRTKYRNDPKFSDSLVWANSADLDQQSDQGLHCLQYCLHLLEALLYGKTSFFQL